MSALDLDALEVLCDGATPGPWENRVEQYDTIEEMIEACRTGATRPSGPEPSPLHRRRRD